MSFHLFGVDNHHLLTPKGGKKKVTLAFASSTRREAAAIPGARRESNLPLIFMEGGRVKRLHRVGSGPNRGPASPATGGKRESSNRTLFSGEGGERESASKRRGGNWQ